MVEASRRVKRLVIHKLADLEVFSVQVLQAEEKSRLVELVLEVVLEESLEEAKPQETAVQLDLEVQLEEGLLEAKLQDLDPEVILVELIQAANLQDLDPEVKLEEVLLAPKLQDLDPEVKLLAPKLQDLAEKSVLAVEVHQVQRVICTNSSTYWTTMDTRRPAVAMVTSRVATLQSARMQCSEPLSTLRTSLDSSPTSAGGNWTPRGAARGEFTEALRV